MDSFTLGFFITFAVVAGLLLIWTIRGIRHRTSARFGTIRIWSLVPFLIYGEGVYPVWSVSPLHPGYRFFGLWLPVWCLISCFISRRYKARGSMKDWESSLRTRGALCILCVDTIIVVFFIVEASRFPFRGGHLPWTMSRDLGKVMRIIMIILLVSQSGLLIPMTRLPRSIEGITLLISRSFASRRRSYVNLGSSHDLEKQQSMIIEARETDLARLLREDVIAQRLAHKLHYNDLVNLSLASKSMRRAVFYPLPSTSSSRIESLCRTSCVSGKKSQCWACERVICRDCRVSRENVYSSRTAEHMRCYAVCSRCYFLRSSSERAAPFQAKWHSHDLANQHVGCSLSSRSLTQSSVHLCSACCNLDEAAVSARREASDAALIQRALYRDLDCATCENVLTTRHRRWWMCDAGGHECHWGGHELNARN